MSEVIASRHGPVATLTLNRPERRNALAPELLGALARHIERLDDDPEVRVVVVEGAGSAFSAGADLEWMRARRDSPSERALEDAAAMQRAFESVDRCGTAVVARIHGPAIGGGAGLVACADVAVASADARFAFGEVRLGLIPAIVSPYVLRAVGPGHARALFTSAASFGAEEALRLGLVHRVVPAENLDAEVAEVAGAFLSCGPSAIAAAKRLIRDATSTLALRDLPERLVAVRAGAEAREGIDAFLAKRPPTWSGSSES